MKNSPLTSPSIFYVVLLSFVAVSVTGWFAGCSSGKPIGPKTVPSAKKRQEAQYLLSEGNLYLNTGKLDLAEDRLKGALKRIPNMMVAMNSLGIVYLKKRQFKKARVQFERVVGINPKFYDAYNYLGVVYMELGNYDRAKENLLRAANAEKYSTPENAYSNLAMLEIQKKRYDAALRYIEKGLLANPNFPPLCNLLGIVYENKGEYKKALIYYEKATSVLTEPEVTHLINMGRVYTKMGKKGKALDILEKALGKALNERMKKQIRTMIAEVERQ
jgi:type IV pilus assembly protein PilF